MEHQKKYKIIYADPAWVYQDKANAGKRGAEHKYTCTPTEEMGKLLDNLPIDKDAVCLMWVTYPQLKSQNKENDNRTIHIRIPNYPSNYCFNNNL